MSTINRELRIRRGVQRQINVIASNGDVLDVSKHGSERVGTICINHRADGKVVISTQDVPFDLSCVFQKPGFKWDGYDPYMAHHSLSRDRKTQLRAMHRAGNGGKWVIALTGTDKYIHIEPGQELKVVHTTGRVAEEQRAAA